MTESKNWYIKHLHPQPHTHLQKRLRISIRSRRLTSLCIIPNHLTTGRVPSRLRIHSRQLTRRRARQRAVHGRVPRPQHRGRESLVEVVGIPLTAAVGQDLGLVDQFMEGVRGVERRLGGDEVEIEDFGLDRRARDGVGDDDLLDFGAELVGVRC